MNLYLSEMEYIRLILFYLIMVALFVHKQRLIATIFVLCVILYVGYATKDDSDEWGLRFSTLFGLVIIFVDLFIILFGMSYLKIDNIYTTYLVTTVVPLVIVYIFKRPLLYATGGMLLSFGRYLHRKLTSGPISEP